MSNYTKRDYEAFAKLCSDAIRLHYDAGAVELTCRIGALFALDNPRFNKEKFYQKAICDVTGWPVSLYTENKE